MEYKNDLRDRTKRFALRIIRLSTSLNNSREADVIGRQVLRSGTSVGAQFREAYRAKSKADYISKLTGAIQELDETQYWLELLIESGIMKKDLLEPLNQESEELLAIITTILIKVKKKRDK
jgi:four helix bundle protein